MNCLRETKVFKVFSGPRQFLVFFGSCQNLVVMWKVWEREYRMREQENGREREMKRHLTGDICHCLASMLGLVQFVSSPTAIKLTHNFCVVLCLSLLSPFTHWHREGERERESTRKKSNIDWTVLENAYWSEMAKREGGGKIENGRERREKENNEPFDLFVLFQKNPPFSLFLSPSSFPPLRIEWVGSCRMMA